MTMTYRILGKSTTKVSSLGLGCMGMSEFYGATNDTVSTEVIVEAFNQGINFFDTADIYGNGHNEELLGNAVNAFRDQVIIASKCGIIRATDDPTARGLNGSATYIKSACDASLKRLKTPYIDLFYLHRQDPNTPIEESVHALADLVTQGKIKYIGLSEIDSATLRKAHAVHPITALQSEYSLWTREPENDVLPTCRELGISFVAYSPLGRGFLSGKITDDNSLESGDFRKNLPRFQQENIDKNAKIVADLTVMAQEKNCTPAQLSLAWVLAQGEDILPIPGTKRIEYLKQNIAALTVKLDSNDLARLDKIAPRGSAHGTRYTSDMMKTYNLK